MARGSKEAYTDKQKRQAEHIEDSYKERGVSDKTAEARAWATVNKTSGGGKKRGSGRSASKKSGSKKSASKKAASKKSTSKSRSTMKSTSKSRSRKGS